MPTATPTVPPASISPVSWPILLQVIQWRPPMPRQHHLRYLHTVQASIEGQWPLHRSCIGATFSRQTRPGAIAYVNAPLSHQFIGNVPSVYGFWPVPFPLAAKGQSSRHRAPGRIGLRQISLKAGGKSTALRDPVDLVCTQPPVFSRSKFPGSLYSGP